MRGVHAAVRGTSHPHSISVASEELFLRSGNWSGCTPHCFYLYSTLSALVLYIRFTCTPQYFRALLIGKEPSGQGVILCIYAPIDFVDLVVVVAELAGLELARIAFDWVLRIPDARTIISILRLRPGSAQRPSGEAIVWTVTRE